MKKSYPSDKVRVKVNDDAFSIYLFISNTENSNYKEELECNRILRNIANVLYGVKHIVLWCIILSIHAR